jgi:hypothetical protein
MTTVELLYDDDCPNVRHARARLMKAFVQRGMTPRWSERRIGDEGTPADYGSPTVLVDGRDVSASAPVAGRCCRIYRDESGSIDDIAIALAASASNHAVERRAELARSWGAGRVVATLPAVFAALLPKVACPMCWPLYAGFLGSVGLGFLMEDAWLMPLTATFLVIALASLAFRARARRGYAPFAAGALASTLVLVGKFIYESNAAGYAGITLLVAASIWNGWPVRRRASCQACNTSEATGAT